MDPDFDFRLRKSLSAMIKRDPGQGRKIFSAGTGMYAIYAMLPKSQTRFRLPHVAYHVTESLSAAGESKRSTASPGRSLLVKKNDL